MDQLTYYLCRQASLPYMGGAFDLGYFSLETTFYVLGHPSDDCRLLGLFLLDDFARATRRNPEETFALAPDRLRTQAFERSRRLFQWFAGTWDSREPPEAGVAPASMYDASAWMPPSTHAVAQAILLVHGTWASGGWWLPDSPFVKYLNGVTGDAVYTAGDQFQWSGRNSHAARVQAAGDLHKWLSAHSRVTTIIAHSHGGNVALLASRLLAASGPRPLQKLILLGTPSRSDYTPNLAGVRAIRNVFSFADLIQTPSGTFPHRRGEGRTVSDSKQALNVVAESGFLGPSHAELHEPSVWQANNLDRLL